MSAIQLLEQLGANASLQTEEAKRALLALIENNKIHDQNEKMWCMMFPEDEQGEDDDKDKDENEKNGNKPDISAH